MTTATVVFFVVWLTLGVIVWALVMAVPSRVGMPRVATRVQATLRQDARWQNVTVTAPYEPFRRVHITGTVRTQADKFEALRVATEVLRTYGIHGADAIFDAVCSDEFRDSQIQAFLEGALIGDRSDQPRKGELP
jgi:hypothetical protein